MTKKTEQEVQKVVVQRYKEGSTAPEISQDLGVSKSAIYRILRWNGIDPSLHKRRGKRGTANRKFSDEEESVIAQQYKDGMTLDALAEMHETWSITIRRVLSRQNVDARTRGGAGVRSFTSEQTEDIKARWFAGQSQTEIAEAYQSSQSTISKLLRLNGVQTEVRQAKGAKHGNWKGGKTSNQNGYVLVKVEPDSPFAPMRKSSEYVMEHRLVMAQYLNRPLADHETVHHINGDKQDNRIENLQLRIGKHGKNQSYRCRNCGSHDVEPVEIED